MCSVKKDSLPQVTQSCGGCCAKHSRIPKLGGRALWHLGLWLLVSLPEIPSTSAAAEVLVAYILFTGGILTAYLVVLVAAA